MPKTPKEPYKQRKHERVTLKDMATKMAEFEKSIEALDSKKPEMMRKGNDIMDMEAHHLPCCGDSYKWWMGRCLYSKLT